MSTTANAKAFSFLSDQIKMQAIERRGVVVLRPPELSGNNVHSNALGFGQYWSINAKPNLDWKKDIYFQDLLRAYSPFTSPDGVEKLTIKVTGKNILLVGCGAGHEIPLLQTLKPAYICALDVGESVYIAAENYAMTNVFFYECDLLKGEHFFKVKFDFIFTAGVLHHTSSPIQSIASLLNMLHVGGYLNILTLSKVAPTGKFYEAVNFFRKYFFSKMGISPA